MLKHGVPNDGVAERDTTQVFILEFTLLVLIHSTSHTPFIKACLDEHIIFLCTRHRLLNLAIVRYIAHTRPETIVSLTMMSYE